MILIEAYICMTSLDKIFIIWHVIEIFFSKDL